MNGYNFTERVRKVLAMAREEAVALHHEYVAPEHALLGLIREGEGVAATVLQNLGVDLDDLRDDVLSRAKQGNRSIRTGPDLPYTSRAKRVLELSMSQARELKHSYVGTEHLLLGLVAEAKSIAAFALNATGVTLDSARAEMLTILGVDEPPRHLASPAPDSRLPYLARRLREIIAAAYDLAAERNSVAVMPAHVAMALLEHDGGSANAALDRLALDREAALRALNDVAPAGADVVEPETVMTPTPALERAFETMRALQREAKAESATTPHLLLALVTTCVEIDAVFAAQRIGAAEIRREVRQISG